MFRFLQHVPSPLSLNWPPLMQKTLPLPTGGSNWPFRCLDSKGFMKFGCLEPSIIMFDFWNVLLVETRLTQFVRVPPYEFSAFLTNIIIFRWNEMVSWGKNILPFSKIIIGKSQVFSARSYVYLHGNTQIHGGGGHLWKSHESFLGVQEEEVQGVGIWWAVLDGILWG